MEVLGRLHVGWTKIREGRSSRQSDQPASDFWLFGRLAARNSGMAGETQLLPDLSSHSRPQAPTNLQAEQAQLTTPRQLGETLFKKVVKNQSSLVLQYVRTVAIAPLSQ